MKIKKLSLKQFRCYQDLELDIKNNINLFIGKNAQGKTSILEAIYVLVFTKSHKVFKDTEMIYNDSDFAKINALINLKDAQVDLDITISKMGKKAKYNQIELKKLSEYIGLMNVVMFSPEDLEMIKGNPKIRRKFLDSEIGQISKEYIYNLANYKNVQKQRNDLLKNMQKDNNQNYLLLDVITEQLIEYQIPILKDRRKFINEIEKYAQLEYKRLSESEDELEIKYITTLTDNMFDEYVKKYKYDIITGTTSLGIHRDDIEFYLNGHPLKTRGSQGEQRTAVLAIKLALLEFVYQYKNEYPILLLDDVLSELDQSRQNRLLEFINKDIQIFITSTNLANINIDKLNNYQIFNIENGHIKECDNNGKQL